MSRKPSPRTKRPSGIEVSANGNYYYWKCNVSGQETFADKGRFDEVVAKFGGEEKLFKTYVLRAVKKYVERGFDAAHIKGLIKANKGKLPSLDANLKERKKGLKKGRKPRLKQFAVGEVSIQQTNETGSMEEVKQKVYPWTGNPDYFKSEAVPFNVAEETKIACLFPNRYLEDMCIDCKVYSQCQSSLKCGEAEWKNPKKRNEIKIVPINPWTGETAG